MKPSLPSADKVARPAAGTISRTGSASGTADVITEGLRKEGVLTTRALSVELETPITPGFEALMFKASRGIEDIYELTYIRKDGSRFPAMVSVTALRDAQDAIIGYLLIGADNTVRKQVEAEQTKLDQRLRDQQFYTRSRIESNVDALMTTDPAGIITDVNRQTEALTGRTRDELIGAPFKNSLHRPGSGPKRLEKLIARRCEMSMVSAVNATLGIALARDSQPQVILMDINLPGISGINALKILRNDPSTAHIPVVALSANAMPRDVKKGLEAGFLSYLTKPIKVNEFMDALDVALDLAGKNPRRTSRRHDSDDKPIRHSPRQNPDRRRPGSQRAPARADAARCR